MRAAISWPGTPSEASRSADAWHAAWGDCAVADGAIVLNRIRSRAVSSGGLVQRVGVNPTAALRHGNLATPKAVAEISWLATSPRSNGGYQRS